VDPHCAPNDFFLQGRVLHPVPFPFFSVNPVNPVNPVKKIPLGPGVNPAAKKTSYTLANPFPAWAAERTPRLIYIEKCSQKWYHPLF
jgi:hypothetical protein